MTRRLRLCLPALVLCASACAATGGVPETSDTPRRDLAVRPTQIAGTPVPKSGGHSSSSTAPSGKSHRAPNNRSASTPSHPIASSAPSSSPTAPFHTFATHTDGANDQGLNAPSYADLRLVSLQDNGDQLRVEIVLSGRLPEQAASDETLGIGLDLYRPGTGRESDYQLFADGEPDGWFAYLDTPKGFVRYPGTFGLGGNRIVFTVPWAAVGSPTRGRYSAFVDWSQRSSGLTGNKASNDYTPAVGTASYAR